MEQLLMLLNGIRAMSPELVLHLQSILESKDIRKGDYLLKAGDVCRNVYFITSGLLRCLYKKGDKDVSHWFMREGDVIFAVESFYTQQPTLEAIEALEDTSLYFISHEQLQYIYDYMMEFNYHGRVLTQKYYLLSEKRSQGIRMQSAPERYQYLLDKHPELVKRVLAKHLASYLGITEETYSRINRGHL